MGSGVVIVIITTNICGCKTSSF